MLKRHELQQDGIFSYLQTAEGTLAVEKKRENCKEAAYLWTARSTYPSTPYSYPPAMRTSSSQSCAGAKGVKCGTSVLRNTGLATVVGKAMFFPPSSSAKDRVGTDRERELLTHISCKVVGTPQREKVDQPIAGLRVANTGIISGGTSASILPSSGPLSSPTRRAREEGDGGAKNLVNSSSPIKIEGAATKGRGLGGLGSENHRDKIRKKGRMRGEAGGGGGEGGFTSALLPSSMTFLFG